MSTPKKVLLCDDSRAIRMVTGRHLTANGYEVIGEAGNGIEAFKQYCKLKPDVVLLDLVMPEKDGKAALKKILEYDENARVVILSSLGSEEDIEECLKMGAKSYMQKPVDPDSMTKILGAIFE